MNGKAKLEVFLTVHGHLIGPFLAEIPADAAKEAFQHGTNCAVIVRPPAETGSTSMLAGSTRLEQ